MVDLQGIDYIRTFLWSPDSKWLLIVSVNEMSLIDVYNPTAEPKRLLRLDGNILEDRIAWSKDLNNVLACSKLNSINPSGKMLV